MNELKSLIQHATTQMDIIDALRKYHQLDRVVAYISTNYCVGYNDDQQFHPEHKAVPMDELKIFIIAALDASPADKTNC